MFICHVSISSVHRHSNPHVLNFTSAYPPSGAALTQRLCSTSTPNVCSIVAVDSSQIQVNSTRISPSSSRLFQSCRSFVLDISLSTFLDLHIHDRAVFNVFFLFCSPSLHLFDSKYSQSCKILKYFHYLK